MRHFPASRKANTTNPRRCRSGRLNAWEIGDCFRRGGRHLVFEKRCVGGRTADGHHGRHREPDDTRHHSDRRSRVPASRPEGYPNPLVFIGVAGGILQPLEIVNSTNTAIMARLTSVTPASYKV